MARNCKYHKIETKVSYDDGQTWESQTPPVYHIGGLIEAHSQDCETGTTLERWITVEGDYLCDGNNKWTKQLLQNSYDGGVTWYASSPTTFRLGEFIEVDEEYCSNASESHYIIPDIDPEESCYQSLNCRTGYRPTYSVGSCRCVYVDPIKVVKCTTDTLTVSNLANGNYGLQTLKIGECTRVINIDSNSGFAINHMRPYLTTIDTTNDINLESISAWSFSYCDGWFHESSTKAGNGLQSIAIPSGMTEIGVGAFYACSAMTSVTISDAQCSIDSSAFAECRSLRVLDLGNSAVTIGSDAFQSCISLSSVTIPSSVTSIGDGAFYGCSSLTSITCLATTPPTLGGGAFDSTGNCPIYVPCSAMNAYRSDSEWGVYAGRIVSIESCPFDGKYLGIKSNGTSQYLQCDSNTTLSGISRSNLVRAEVGSCVTTIGEKCFSACTSLSSVTFDSGVTEVANSGFTRCSGLTNVDFIDNLTSIGNNAFMWCYALSSVTTPIGLTTIGNGVFAGCTGLTSVTINGDTVGSSMFSSCTSLRNVSMNSALSIGNSAFTYCNKINRISAPSATSVGNSAFYDCSGLTSINLPSVTTVGSKAFNRCYYLQNITLPNATTIGSNAFSGCTYLYTLNLPSATAITSDAVSLCWNLRNVYLSSVTSIPDYMFARDSYGNKFKLEVIDISNVTTIGTDAFRGCDSLTSVTIPSGVTSIGNYAFYNCSGLTSITVEATTPPTLVHSSSYSSAFGGTGDCPIYVPCESLETYRDDSQWGHLFWQRLEPIPSTAKLVATYSDSSVASICCNDSSTLTSSEISNLPNPRTAMTSADIGSCVTSIGGDAFNYYVSLTSCTIPSSVTSIGNRAFQDCSGLTSINIPDSVTSISNYAFRYCSGLTSIEIGSGVTSIGNMSFWSCTNLTSITVNALTPPTLGSSVLYGTPIASGTGTIYVPAASVSSYQSASGWSDYASRIQAIT